jgi:hypothetical protein
MLWLRALAVWVGIVAAETVHGTLRTSWLAPQVGDFRARQIAVFTGSLIVVAIAWLSIRWLRAPGTGALLAVGLLWAALTLGFDLVLGRFVFGYAWQRMAEDFDVAHGGLLPFGILVLAASPLVATKLRGPAR